MWFEVFVLLYAIATGYVAAGLVSSFYSLMTSRPASFEIVSDKVVDKLMQLPVIVMGGPAILMRNAVRGRLIEHRPVGWLFASLAIAVSWSFVSGLFVIHLALSI